MCFERDADLSRCETGENIALFFAPSRSNFIHRGILLFPYPLGPYAGESLVI